MVTCTHWWTGATGSRPTSAPISPTTATWAAPTACPPKGSTGRPTRTSWSNDEDRGRLTADGQVRDYLFARTESGLRVAMRSVATDADLVGRWLAAVRGKAAVHDIDDPTFHQPDRSTSAIGG